MPIPFRMNPISIELRLLARKGRFVGKDKPNIDPVYRRPRGPKIYHGPNTSDRLVIKAQIVYDRQEDKVPTELGDAPNTSGHLTLRKKDWDALQYKPDKSDLIVKIEDDEVEYEITQVMRAGYLRGKARLVMIYFQRTKEFTGSP